MTSPEAAKLLEVPPDASPEQIEARFLELRTKLEERIGKAPTPGLKEKYRATLNAVTEAFETLTLAADSSSLPVLRRTESPVVTAPPPPSATAPVEPEAPAAPAARPGKVIHHLAALIKFSIAAGAFSLLGVAVGIWIANQRPSGDTTATGASDPPVLLALCSGPLIGLAVGIYVWLRSLRKARSDVTGRRYKRDRRFVFGAAAGVVVVIGAVGLLLLPSMSERSEWNDSLHLRSEYKPEVDAELDAAIRTEAEAEAELAALRKKERELARDAQKNADELRNARALVKAHESYVKWLGETLIADPARRNRLKSEAAFTLVETAPTKANDEAAQNAFIAYRDSVDSLGMKVKSRRPDPEWVVAVDWAREGALEGDPESMYQLGYAYERGNLGVNEDRALAVEWYRKAADKGNVRAMTSLAIFYSNGDGVPKDETTAFEWWRKAADHGDTDAMKVAAEFFQKGRGVPRDPAMAVEWRRKAAEKDDADAMYSLGINYHEGLGVPKDDAAAVEWYRRAADKGNANAMYLLGVHYDQGLGVARNEATALDWWRKAEKAGHYESERLLTFRNSPAAKASPPEPPHYPSHP